VPELPVADVECAQQYYRDTLGFEIGWLYPGNKLTQDRPLRPAEPVIEEG